MLTLKIFAPQQMCVLSTVAILAWLPFQSFLDPFEIIGVLSGSWSFWMLARNKTLGWGIDLIYVSIYMLICFKVQLYGDVGMQVFYIMTDLQALRLWLYGGANKTEKPISRLSPKAILLTIPLILVGIFLLNCLLQSCGGSAPLVNSTTVILSITAQLYLISRYCESWYLLGLVYLINVPLYASEGLLITSASYILYFIIAINGLRTFRRTYQQQLCLATTQITN